MSKDAQRKAHKATPGAGDAGIHQRIAQQAQQAKTCPFGIARAGKYPDLEGLLKAMQEAVGQAAPARVVYQGRPYWVRVSHGMTSVEVFDSPGAGEPMARTICGSTDRFGHTPGH